MSIRTLLVDDEELARALLREFASRQPDLEIVGECGNGFEAVKTISAARPDLVFLDVQMPKLNGFEVLELIDAEVAVVFTTAHDQYAMKAFDAAAVDYLLKPFDEPRFTTAVERVRKRLGEKRGTADVAELKSAAQAPGTYLTRIVVKDGSKIHIIPTADLAFAEAQDDYVALFSHGKQYLKQQTLSSLESQLNPQEFIRLHRSHLVRLDAISKIEPYTRDTRMAVLKDGRTLPVSRAGYMRFRELMDR